MKRITKWLTSVFLTSMIVGTYNSKTISFFLKDSFIGNKENLFIENEKFSANIQSWNISSVDLGQLYRESLGQMDVIDLTALTGIKVLSVFKKIYSAIELPDFHASVSLFTRNEMRNCLTISTNNWQEDWKSKQRLLVEGIEMSGFSRIYGQLTMEFEILKHKKTNHLLLKIHFYGTGDYLFSFSHSLATISSGSVLNLNVGK